MVCPIRFQPNEAIDIFVESPSFLSSHIQAGVALSIGMPAE